MTDAMIRPLRGLWRVQNEGTAPPGSCRTLDNCCIRKQGIVEPFPDIQNQGFSNPTYPIYNHFDAPGDASLLLYETEASTPSVWLTKSSGATAGITLADATVPTYEAARARLVHYRGRFYLTTKQGLVCMDSNGDQSARRAGFPFPLAWNGATAVSTDAQAIPTGKYVGYRVTFERELTDGSLVIGPPTTALLVNNATGGTRDYNLLFAWENPTAEVVAGDYVAVYRTDAADTSSVGDTFRLVKRVQLTSSHITAEAITVKDDVPEAQLGVELYTNPGQKGPVKAHYPAPYLRDVVLYKGCLIGVAYRERHAVTLRIPGAWGTLSTDADRTTGIGKRVITGDITSGTATILNVSASHMKGIGIGQLVENANFPATTQVTAASGTTITCDTNATGTSGGATINIYDLIEIDGVEYTASQPGTVAYAMIGQDDENSILFSQPIADGVAHTNLEFVIANERASHASGAFGVRGTNGSNYSPNIPALASTAKAADPATQTNRIAWSEPDEPEHWPLVNRDIVGTGEILKLIEAGDAVYIFNSDGRVYRMSGEPDAWRYDQVAENLLLLGANACVAYQGTVFAWTDRGLVAMQDGFVRVISDRIANDLKTASLNIAYAWAPWMTVDAHNKELWLLCGDTTAGRSQPWIYNLETDEWYRLAAATYVAPAYIASEPNVFVGQWSGTAHVMKEFVDTDEKMDATEIELNRLDFGNPGALKKWREIVWLFRPASTGAETFAFVTTADKEVGAGSVSTSYAPTLNATSAVELPCHVGRNSGLSAQLRVKLTRATHVTPWEIEGIVARADVLVDRTGARAA